MQNTGGPGTRGFDQLMNPMGMAVIVIAAFLVLGFIVAGAVFVRISEREKRARKDREN